MTIWKYLKIDATTETKLIKQAYAKELRNLLRNNETDAQRQLLKEAFDSALSLAKNNQSLSAPLVEKKAPAQRDALFLELTQLKLTSTCPPQNLTFKAQLHNILENPTERFSLEAWNKLLAEQLSWSLAEFLDNQRRILTLLVDEGYGLSKNIIHLLLNTFDLNHPSDEVEQDFLWREFNQVAPILRDLPDFSFSNWAIIDPELRNEFFKLRLSLFVLLSNHESASFSETYEQARAICPDDHDLLTLFLLHKLDLVGLDIKDRKVMSSYLAPFADLLFKLKDTSATAQLLYQFYYSLQFEQLQDVIVVAQLEESDCYLPLAKKQLLLGYTYFRSGDWQRANYFWDNLVNSTRTDYRFLRNVIKLDHNLIKRKLAIKSDPQPPVATVKNKQLFQSQHENTAASIPDGLIKYVIWLFLIGLLKLLIR